MRKENPVSFKLTNEPTFLEVNISGQNLIIEASKECEENLDEYLLYKVSEKSDKENIIYGGRKLINKNATDQEIRANIIESVKDQIENPTDSHFKENEEILTNFLNENPNILKNYKGNYAIFLEGKDNSPYFMPDIDSSILIVNLLPGKLNFIILIDEKIIFK